MACHGIEASWAGGVKGREVTDKFLPKVASLLSPAGAFYLIVIKENDPGKLSVFLPHIDKKSNNDLVLQNS